MPEGNQGLGHSAPLTPFYLTYGGRNSKNIQRAPPSGLGVPDLRGRMVASRNYLASGPRSLQMEGLPPSTPPWSPEGQDSQCRSPAGTPAAWPLPSRLQAQMVLHLLNLEEGRGPMPASATGDQLPHRTPHPPARGPQGTPYLLTPLPSWF